MILGLLLFLLPLFLLLLFTLWFGMNHGNERVKEGEIEGEVGWLVVRVKVKVRGRKEENITASESKRELMAKGRKNVS